MERNVVIEKMYPSYQLECVLLCSLEQEATERKSTTLLRAASVQSSEIMLVYYLCW